MEMRHIGNANDLLKKFPILKVIPQVKDILKDVDNLDFWIRIFKGEIYIGKEQKEPKESEGSNGPI